MSASRRPLPRAHLPNRAVRFLLGVAIDAIDHAAEIADLHDAQRRLDASVEGNVSRRGDRLRGLLDRLGTIEADLYEIIERFPGEFYEPSEEPV